MDAAARHQRALNRDTAGNWQHYAGHRRRISELLATGKPGKRLCVLGAGNCNDLDLEGLLAHFSEIALFDLDAESLNGAAQRQPEAVRRALVLRAPVDFGGLGPEGAAPPAPLDAPASARALAGKLGAGNFDVVASTCVLSQLIGEVPRRWGERHPRCLELVQFARAVHLHLMLELLRPGGRGVLVSDMVSSDTCPALAKTPGDELPALMARVAAQKNFFTGLNPFAVELLLKKDPSLSTRMNEVALQSPWLWQMGPERSYLTFALTFSRRPESPRR